MITEMITKKPRTTVLRYLLLAALLLFAIICLENSILAGEESIQQKSTRKLDASDKIKVSRRRLGFNLGRFRDNNQQPLTPAQETKILKYIAKTKPAEIANLKKKKTNDARRYQYLLRRWWTWYKTPDEIRQAQSEQYNSRVKIRRLVTSLKKTYDQAKRTKLVDLLRAELENKFDADMVVQKHKLTALDSQIEQHKEHLDYLLKQRDTIIAEQVEYYLKQAGKSLNSSITPDAKSASWAGNTQKNPVMFSKPEEKPIAENKNRIPKWRQRIRHDRRRSLTEKQETELLDALKAMLPELHDSLTKIKIKNKRQYQSKINHIWPFYQKLNTAPKNIQKHMITQYKCRITIWRLSSKITSAADSKTKKELTQELIRNTAMLFDTGLELRKYGLGKLEKHIRLVKKKLAQRLKDRTKIIESQLLQIISPQSDTDATANSHSKCNER